MGKAVTGGGSAVSRQRQAVIAAGAGYGTSVILMVLGFVITPFVLRHLGQGTYGVWAIIGQVIGYVGLSDMGVGSALMAYASRMLRTSHPNELSELSSTALVIQFGLGTVGLLFALALAPFLDRLIDTGGVDTRVIVISVGFLALAWFVKTSLNTYDQLLVAHQMLHVNYLVGFASQLFRLALVVVLLTLGAGLIGMALAAFLSNVFLVVVIIRKLRTIAPKIVIHPRHFKQRFARKLLSFSLWGMVGRFSATVIYNTDNLVVGAFLGAPAVTVYVLSRRLPEVLRQNIYRIGNALRPGLGDVSGSHDAIVLRRTFLSAARTYVFIAIVGGVIIGWTSRRFVSLWVGSSNYGGDLLVWITVASTVTLSLFHISSVVLVSGLRVKVVSTVRLAEAILNIGLSIMLVRLGFGLVGVAAGTLIANVLTSAVLIPIQAIKQVGLDVKDFARSVIVGPVAGGVATALGCWVLGRIDVLGRETWASTLAFLAIMGVLAGFLLLFYGIEAESRKRLVGVLLRR